MVDANLDKAQAILSSVMNKDSGTFQANPQLAFELMNNDKFLKRFFIGDGVFVFSDNFMLQVRLFFDAGSSSAKVVDHIKNSMTQDILGIKSIEIARNEKKDLFLRLNNNDGILFEGQIDEELVF